MSRLATQSSGSGLASWRLDYHLLPSAASSSSSSSQALVGASPNSTSLDPPGYTPRQPLTTSKKSQAAAARATRVPPTPEQLSSILSSKAWELATSPLKSLPMNLFMLYMSGNGVQIFSMMIVGMLLTNPLKAILATRDAFAPLTPPAPTSTKATSVPASSLPAHLPQMLAYVAAQIVCFGLGIYKCWSMGLLPTESSDWLAWKEPAKYLEFGPISA